MHYQQILQNLADKKYAPLYFLQGMEPFYIHTILQYIEENVVPPQAKSFDMRTLYGHETTLQQILTHAKRFPMIASHQVVLVKEAQHLQDLQKESGKKQLLQYLENPNPQTLLVFAYLNKTLDQRRTFAKTLAKKALLFTAAKLYERDIPHWLKQYLHTEGFQITPDATQMLTALVGDNLQILTNELKKLTATLTKGDTITLQAVQQHVTSTKTYDIFSLQQAIQTHQPTRIWHITEYFAQNPKKYPLLPQISLLTNLFTKLLLLHHIPHASTAEIASKLRIPPYFAKNYQAALTHYPLPKVIQNLHHLHQTDLHIKGIGFPTTPDTTLLKNLVAHLI